MTLNEITKSMSQEELDAASAKMGRKIVMRHIVVPIAATIAVHIGFKLLDRKLDKNSNQD